MKTDVGVNRTVWIFIDLYQSMKLEMGPRCFRGASLFAVGQ